MNIIIAILWAIFGIISAITIGLFAAALIYNARKKEYEKREENKNKENKKD